MAPKSKGAATKPKVKVAAPKQKSAAKAAAAKQSAKAAAPTPQKIVAEPEPQPEEISPSKRTWSDRRDPDAQVRRIMTLKLSHIDGVVLKTKTTKEGVTVFNYIKNEVLKTKQWNGRLRTQFWTKFWQDFDLSRDISSELPEPPESDEEGLEDELLDAMTLARSKNPAERCPDSLCYYLEHCSKLSEGTLRHLWRDSAWAFVVPSTCVQVAAFALEVLRKVNVGSMYP